MRLGRQADHVSPQSGLSALVALRWGQHAVWVHLALEAGEEGSCGGAGVDLALSYAGSRSDLAGA